MKKFFKKKKKKNCVIPYIYIYILRRSYLHRITSRPVLRVKQGKNRGEKGISHVRLQTEAQPAIVPGHSTSSFNYFGIEGLTKWSWGTNFCCLANYQVLLEHSSEVLHPLIFMVDLIMNLINEMHHKYWKRKRRKKKKNHHVTIL